MNSVKLISSLNRKDELLTEQQILMWGHGNVIPNMFRLSSLNELHGNHLVIFEMKSLARSYFWWPSLDKDCEIMPVDCESCQIEKPNTNKVLLHV